MNDNRAVSYLQILFYRYVEKEYESKTNYYEQKTDFPIVVIARNDRLS